MGNDNFFFNAYKKNVPNKPVQNTADEPLSPQKEKVVKPYVFEKVPTTPFEKPEKKEEPVPPQKTGTEINKTRLSALFLMLSGVDAAVAIVKTFTEDEINKIIKEMMKIERVSEEDLSLVKNNFGNAQLVPVTECPSGKEFTRMLLQKLYGITNGSDKFVKVVEEEEREATEYIEKLNASQIKDLLTGESNLIFSILLSFIKPAKAAEVIKTLPPDRAAAVIKMLSTKTKIGSEVVGVVLAKLNERAKEMVTNEGYRVQGKLRLIEIVRTTDTENAERIINAIQKDDPTLAAELRENIFTFNDVIKLPKKELECVLKEYDNKEIAFILKGVSEEVKTVYLTCVTQRRRTLIEDEIKLLGKVKKSDVEEKRKTFLEYIRKLEEDGKISLVSDKDIYVE